MKFSIELKILIGFLAGAVILWLIFALGDTTGNTINNVFLTNGRANIENIDPIYTNAMINAKTYGLVNQNIEPSVIPELFFATYIGTNVKSIKILSQKSIGSTEIANIFSNYTFVTNSTIEIMKKYGIVQTANASSLNSNFQNYNVASIQSMLAEREKIPQFAAYDYTIEITANRVEKVHVIVMRALSSAMGQPYKHLRWVVSYVYH
ncbi:hypothetical protein [Athalassotoga saccharophila]|uniref:hypothetical protein n=1 Tax=Athalassotoga saccharophila TaxID=1441386 RepID=UPI00137B0534|nr:hypothetical protein [Athalassotoga saccharophila]BBJ27772.1 hypothetical protein ATHSA_0663 [Athalassotoga saccharophila]